jgi:DNA polymerase
LRLPESPEFRSCAKCGLCNTAETGDYLPIPGEGPVPARIAFIGQAPGKVEQRIGKPFQGPAGKVLDAVIEEAGLTRDQIYITNTVKQRPDDGGKDRKPTFAEMMACRGWLDVELAVVNPRVVVLFGESAHQIAFPGTKPHQCVGSARVTAGRIWLAAYHPAFVLYRRDPGLRGLLVDVVKQAKEFAS